ncbi:response regulator [Candidatus Albibeggiatoa sp. nov. BB20]|uniref:response regulator n=1 Tax=Candidatus Albibeggiatoa sp. nov. BB20 TaxID=3162723 RepID=UPI0033654707
MAAILKPEHLEILQVQVANEAYNLYESLAVFMDTQVSTDVLDEAINDCVDYLKNVNQSAEQAHLEGLQTICHIARENIQALPQVEADIRQTICEEIEFLPQSISNYLYAPNSESYRTELVDILKNNQLPHAISPDEAHTLNTLLANDFSPNTSSENLASMTSLDDLANDTVDTDLTPIPEVEQHSEDLSAAPEPLLSNAEFDALSDETVGHLSTHFAPISHTESNDDMPFPAGEVVLPESDMGDDMPLPELDTAVFDELATDDLAGDLANELPFIPVLDEDIDSIIESEVSEETVFDSLVGDVTEETLEQISAHELEKMVDEQAYDDELPDDLEDDLDNLPDLDSLDTDELDALSEEIKHDEIEADDAFIDSFLQTEAAQDHPEQEEEATAPKPDAKPSKTLTALSNKVVDLTDDLSQSLNKFSTTDYDSDDFLTAVEEYTNTVQILWEAAGDAHLSSLQSVCTFINENIFELSSQSQEDRFAVRELFAQCPQLILNYLQLPEEGAAGLIEHLQQPEWVIHLNDEDVHRLSVQLVQEVMVSQLEEPSYKPVDLPVVEEEMHNHPALFSEQEDEAQPEIEMTRPDWGEAYIDEDVLLASEVAELEQAENEALLDDMDDEDLADVAAALDDVTPDDLPDDLDAAISEGTDETFGEGLEQLPTESIDEISDQDLEDLPTESIDEISDQDLEDLPAESIDEISDQDLEDLPAESIDEISDQDLENLSESLDSEIDDLNDVPAILDNAVDDLETLPEVLDNAIDDLDELPETLDNAIDDLDAFPEDLDQSLDDVSDLSETLDDAVDELEALPESLDDAIDELEALPETVEEPVSEELTDDLPTALDDELLDDDLDSIAEPLETETVDAPDDFIGETTEPVEEIQLADIEVLEAFSAELTEATDDLTSALNLFATSDNDSPELLEAIERCSDNIQSISDAADNAQLQGLQDVSIFLNDNIFALSTHESSIRRAAKPLLEKTLDLLQEYIYAPHQITPILLAHLENPSWIQPLEEEQQQELLARLAHIQQETVEIAAPDIIEELPAEPVVEHFIAETDDSVQEEMQLADPDILNILIMQVNDCAEGLSTTLTTLTETEDGGEDLLEAVETYTEQVQSVWEVAELAQLTGLQDVCTFINDNVTGLGVQDQEARYNARHLFADWPQLVLGYLEVPSTACDLVEHLQSDLWSSPLDAPQGDVLLEHLMKPATIAGQEPAETVAAPIVLADPDVLELIAGQISDSALELQVVLDTIVQAEDGSEDQLLTIENYTEQVQGIWDVADMAQLAGLQDVCTFINDNVMALGMLEQSTRQSVHPIFASWTQPVLNYLNSPVEGAQEIIDLAKDERWLMPMHADDAQALHAKLLKSDRVEMAAPQVLAEPIPAPIVKTIEIAPPETIDLLVAQVTETSTDLNVTLSKLMAAEDGSEDLLLAVDAYTENVQVIWDTAEMAQLSGLQDVCSFINDNVMALSMHERNERQAAQSVFSAWPDYVVNYLQTPVSGTQELVSHLQNSQWASPLENPDQLSQDLLAGGQTVQESVPSPVAPVADVAIAAPETLELIRAQITDVVEGLSAALEVCVSMENDNPKLFEAVEEYTNQVQVIWDVADMAGLVGLREVCTFVNDNITNFVLLDKETKLEKQSYFETWPSLVLDYLNDPEEGSQQLVLFLQDETWPVPLEAEQAPILLEQLSQSSSSSEQVAAYEAQIAQEEQAEYIAPEPEPAAEMDADMGDGGEISLGNDEVLEILRSEMESTKEELSEKLEQFTSLESSDPLFKEVAENYAEQVQRLNMAAEMMGLDGIQTVANLVTDNVNAWATTDLATRQKAKKPLSEWPDLVLAYLISPMDSVIAMLNHFRESFWIKPLPDSEAHGLLNQLTAGTTADEDSEMVSDDTDSRQTVASEEDISLELPEDINPELLEAYLQETPQHALEFSECIQNIIQEPDKAELEKAKRIAHTLKGSSNILGVKGIASMGHHLEDILEYLTEHQVVPPKELTDVMVEVADCIESMVGSLTGDDDAPDNSQELLQQVLDWANQIDKGELKAPPAPTKSAASAKKPKAEKKEKKAKPKTDTAAPEQMLRVPTRTVDDLMRLVGELSISMGQIQERLKHVTTSTRVLTEQDLLLQKKTFELENLVDVRGITNLQGGHHKTLAEEEEEDFDPLEFEEYNELHSVAHSFIESIADSRELAMSIRGDLSELELMFIHQERLNKEFEATIMTTRMVPVNTVISKLQRNIRQTCRAVNKKAELEVIGDDLLIDSDVLSNLGDPLMHILRNSIDHGLETPEERIAAGKPEEGTVIVHFYREGNNIVVACKDDGKGLNYPKIRELGVKRGLITENQELSENELARLILMSGFSTKEGVTQVSGRGVGMDVVYTNIRNMKGTLDIFSTVGEGSDFIIKLPLTLVTVHVLIVRTGSTYYGIPTSSIEQALAHSSGEFKMVGNERHLEIGKNIYQLKALSDLISVQSDYQGIDNCENRPIILAREETTVVAVVVDELVDTHDLVMKSMGNYVKKVRGVSGASILGDGSLVPLLDLPELLSSPMQSMMSFANDDEGMDMAVMGSGAPAVMVVDDSLSVRKSMSLLLEDAGFEVILAKDGLEAIEVMNQQRPKVMLVDMEMPRMNGLELTAHVRANQETGNIPIFMITSRTTEKHREQAKAAGVDHYLTKPYQDTELLDLVDQALAGKIR